MEQDPKQTLVVLEDAGRNQIAVITEIRALTGLGLKAAKTIVDRTPSSVYAFASAEQADEAAQRLRKAGAKAAAVRPDSPQAQAAQSLEKLAEVGSPSLKPEGPSFVRFLFWALLLGLAFFLWRQFG